MAQPIAPCLWFDGKAEEAVAYYVSIFKDARVLHVDRFSDVGPDPAGQIVLVEFELNGQPFQALDGGPEFTFNEAISLAIDCATQDEVDYYWDALTRDGGQPGPCGWLKDKYGVSWQIVPRAFTEMMRADNRERAGQAMRKMYQMTKLDMAELQAAFDE